MEQNITDNVIIEKIIIGEKEYEYFMTDSAEDLKKKLYDLGCRMPYNTDYRYNPYLSKDVKEKMLLHKTRWSITTSNNVAVLNFYTGSDPAYIVYLSDLIDIQKGIGSYMQGLTKILDSIDNYFNSQADTSNATLFCAVALKRIDMIKLLLESGCDVNAYDKGGYTALMFAILLGDVELVELLIRYGADVNLNSRVGLSPLFIATYQNKTDIVQVLLKNGARIVFNNISTVNDKKKSFSETLNDYIESYCRMGPKRKISEIYKNCNISKQNFSKMRAQENDYRPRKETVLQLIIGLKLNFIQANKLLLSAGLTFDERSETDKIILEAIAHADYDFDSINARIYEATGESLIK